MAPRVKRPDREIFNRYYSTPKEQEVSKYIPVAQELDKKLDDFVRFTSSPEEFKKALKEKFDGNIDQFNQYLILSALTLEYLKKAAEEDEGLKKLLSSLQEKRDAINKNMENIAKELGYTVSQYSLDKLMGKDLNGLNGVMETLAKDFGGVKPKLEALFSPEALNSLTDLFAFMVSKYPISSVNASVPAVPIISDKNNKIEDKDKQKSPEEKAKEESVKVLQQQKEEYHSPYRKYGRNIVIGATLAGVLGGLLFAGSLFYPPLMGWGLAGMAVAVGAGFIVPLGVVIWAAGLIGEAWHNHLVQKAQEEALKEEKKRKKAQKEALKEEKKRKKAQEEALKEEKKRKKAEKNELNNVSWEYNNKVKDEEALKKQLTNQAWLEKHIKAETEAEHKKRVEEAKKEIEKIMEEAKKRNYTTALHDLLIEKAKDPNTPSWFLALLAQLRLSYHYTDVDMLKALAGNPNTPPELLADFATRKRYFWTAVGVESGSDIREIAAKNQSTPPEILAKLLEDKDPRVERAAAANPSTPPDALDTAMYSKKVDINIKKIIAENPSTPESALVDALKDKDLAYHVIKNPSFSKSPGLLKIASNNPDRSISDEADKILRERMKELEEQIKNNENNEE